MCVDVGHVIVLCSRSDGGMLGVNKSLRVCVGVRKCGEEDERLERR